MKSHCLPVTAALLAALACLPVLAQPVTPAAVAAASASASRLLSPAEQRDNSDATAGSTLRVEAPVTPQIKIPFGRKPAPPSSTVSPAARARAATPSGGVNDSAARCEAEVDINARADCRERLARAKPR